MKIYFSNNPMEEKGPRFKSMLIERRIPHRDKKDEFDSLVASRKTLINELRKILKRDPKSVKDLELKIQEIEKEIFSISSDE